MKPLQAIENNAGGYDLLTERDGGNEIRILTGKKERSIEYWTRLKSLAENVLFTLEEGLPAYKEKNIHP